MEILSEMRSDVALAVRQYTSRIIRPVRAVFAVELLSMYTPQLSHAMRKPALPKGIFVAIPVPRIVKTKTQPIVFATIFPTFLLTARHTQISRRYDTNKRLRKLVQNGYVKENEYRKQIEQRPPSYRPGHITANPESHTIGPTKFRIIYNATSHQTSTATGSKARIYIQRT